MIEYFMAFIMIKGGIGGNAAKSRGYFRIAGSDSL